MCTNCVSSMVTSHPLEAAQAAVVAAAAAAAAGTWPPGANSPLIPFFVFCFCSLMRLADTCLPCFLLLPSGFCGMLQRAGRAFMAC